MAERLANPSLAAGFVSLAVAFVSGPTPVGHNANPRIIEKLKFPHAVQLTILGRPAIRYYQCPQLPEEAR